MNDRAVALTAPPKGDVEWLAELKSRIYAARRRAALAVDAEMLLV